MRVQIEETADDSKRLRSSERVARDLNRQVAVRTTQLAAANEELKRSESLLNAEKRTLEMIANGASLTEILNDMCAAIDAHAPAATSMVCLMDPDGKQLLPAAGPRVPAAFNDGHHTLADWPRQRFLRHRRIYQATSDYPGYIQRSAMAR